MCRSDPRGLRPGGRDGPSILALIALVVSASFELACPVGTFDYPYGAPVQQREDEIPGDGSVGRQPDATILMTKGSFQSAPTSDGGQLCAAKGVAHSCDPVKLSGCTQGSCYMTAKLGPACVCPVGSAKEGASCKTGVACAPGLACVGTSAPGICRAVCLRSKGGCPSGKHCDSIQGASTYGVCIPN